LPEFEKSVADVQESEYICDDWFWVPLQDRPGNAGDSFPPVPIPWFSLPSTHVLEVTNGTVSDALNEYLVAVFGWSQGLRLIPEGWGHFYRVAVKQRKLSDFVILDQTVLKLLGLAEEFWHRHRIDGLASKMFGAIHWYLFSQSYRQYFERFMMQYIVLDTIYNIQASISGIKCRAHAERVEYLSRALNVPVPSWGKVVSSGGAKRSEISIIRNELFHEARFANAPIGFKFPTMDKGNMLIHLQSFNSRLFAALLGATGNYSRSSCENRNRHLFHID